MPSQRPINTNLTPFQLLSEILDFTNDDQHDWWQSTGPMLAKLLQDAGYNSRAQYTHLCIHHKCVVPFLGPYPENGKDRWMSILSRFGLPYQLSLNCSKSVVRFAFEPIGPLSGTKKDPFNSQAIWECLGKLIRLNPSIDLQWFTQLKNDLVLDKDEAELVMEHGLDRGQVRTQNKLALDLNGSRFEVKLYIYPYLKSVVTGIRIEQLMFNSVRKLNHNQKLTVPLSILEEYINSHRNQTLTTRLISCDLVDPSRSRIKIYVAEQSVDWEHLEDIWTLGHRRQDPATINGLKLLRELWDLINIPEGLPLLANFTLSPKEPYPAPQVYFHTFGMSDAGVADAIATFCERRGWADMANLYKDNLFSYYPDIDANAINYLQSLVSFSYRDGKAYLSVYLHTFETGGFRKSWTL
ncbi:tryptophan dimethylallyltransferase [Microsporum canis CBS 113480]|uniref:Tryptophan dimethylallyltransferase n=1 Tax=Arthroderma otae (strain ATCC MYA-4605 / CBS 113480) TaxID=554155 RepID=C5FRX1_ARTOC|nr:tryptophan dimethylallyltransferase [Microsporum canis CBS 113480]EEQ32624.1 tryptophan dimethylallyltransferase [Microsporum canis CBS 113480]